MNDKKSMAKVSRIYEQDLPAIFDLNKNTNLTFWTLNQFKTELLKASEFNLKISNENQIISGFIISSLVLEDLHIYNLCILKELQNKGLGSFLLNHTLDLAQKKNAKYAYLEVRSNNIKAINLYKKYGFIQDCTRKRYYSNNDDALLMHLDFSLLDIND